jgi:hypothetical protein
MSLSGVGFLLSGVGGASRSIISYAIGISPQGCPDSGVVLPQAVSCASSCLRRPRVTCTHSKTSSTCRERLGWKRDSLTGARPCFLWFSSPRRLSFPRKRETTMSDDTSITVSTSISTSTFSTRAVIFHTERLPPQANSDPRRHLPPPPALDLPGRAGAPQSQVPCPTRPHRDFGQYST